jgi:pimeloyl-ACP methyl ester carboxylesterase
LETTIKEASAVVEYVITTITQDSNQASSTDTPRRLAVRWSPGHGDPSLPPVCIPNGLGATLFTIATLHDLLEAKGYPVLSYDRAGVGLSDPLPAGEAYSVDGLIKDLKAVMDHRVPASSNRQWLLVGPSMGSIVCQVFIARHPGHVLGFLNMDGLPFPFAAKRGKFEAAGKVYCITSCLTYTGVLRPLLALASGPLAALASKHFTVDMIRAQMNQPNFYESIAREMTLMLDLCDVGVEAWAPAFDLGKLNTAEREILIRAPPTACGDALDATQGPGKWVDLPRAPVERGSDWASATEVRTVLRRLLARAAQQQQEHQQQEQRQQQEVVHAETEGGKEEAVPLWLTFQSLVVRVMSARCYNFGLASSFYDGEMQSLAAMEHALHAALAGEGGQRLVFPTRSHVNMFFGLTGLVAAQVDEIARVNAERKGLPMPELVVEDDAPANSTPAEDMV